MFRRVTATLHFTEPDEAKDFYHDCELAILKSQTINPGEVTEERGTIILEECYHDEDPVKPCHVLNMDSTPQKGVTNVQ